MSFIILRVECYLISEGVVMVTELLSHCRVTQSGVSQLGEEGGGGGGGRRGDHLSSNTPTQTSVRWTHTCSFVSRSSSDS